MTYSPVKTQTGSVLQSGVPKSPKQSGPLKANGLNLRGVVLVTYEVDNDAHPEVDVGKYGTTSGNQIAYYCDCIVISNIPGFRWNFLPKVLVSQTHGGIQSGHIWKPRASSMDVTGSAIDTDKGTIPTNLDGDNVIIQFLNDNLAEPVITGWLPHSIADTGQEDESAGHRMKLKVADGDPDYWKHRGAFYGISKDGDFVIDLTQAYATDLDAEGKQPTPPDDGSTGNFVAKIQKGSKCTIEVDGDSSKSPAISETLKTFYGSGVKAKHDDHVHPTGTGPSGKTVTTMTAYDDNITSTKVDIPDG